jgi:lipopolysaccharide cholinephosphotransferase
MNARTATDSILQEHQQALLVLLKEFDRICKSLGIPYVLYAGTLLGAVRHKGMIPWDDDIDVLMLRSDYERFLEEADRILDRDRFFLQKEFSEHWPMFFSKLRLNRSTCIENYHPKDSLTHRGIYIDVFPLDNAAPSALGRRIQFLASKIVIAKCLDARGYHTKSILKRLILFSSRILPMYPFLQAVKRGEKSGALVHGFFAGGKRYHNCIFRRKSFEQRFEVPFEGSAYSIPKEFDEILTVLYGEYMTLPPEEDRKRKRHAIFVDTALPYWEYKGQNFETAENDNLGSLR